MNTNQYRLAIAAGAVGLVWWQSASDNTKQGIFSFLSQLPAAIEDAERRRTRPDSRTQITPVLAELSTDLLDEQSVAEILSDLRHLPSPAVVELPALEFVTETPRTESTHDPESDWYKVIPHPAAVLILGKKGSGKSALAYRLLELFRFRTDAYAVGLPDSAAGLLPAWIGTVESLKDLPLGSTAVVDEAHLRYNSRDSHSNDSRSISEALNLCRQRGQTIIVISQEARQIDKNIASSVDAIVFKEPAMLQIEFERRELRSVAENAVSGFRSVEGSTQAWSYVHSPAADFTGMLDSRLPSFWTEKLSRAFASGIEPTVNRIAPGATIEEKRERAHDLKTAGHSYGSIARVLGVSKATAVNYVKGYLNQR